MKLLVFHAKKTLLDVMSEDPDVEFEKIIIKDIVFPIPYQGFFWNKDKKVFLSDYDAILMFGVDESHKRAYDFFSPHILTIGNPYSRSKLASKYYGPLTVANAGIPVIPYIDTVTHGFYYPEHFKDFTGDFVVEKTSNNPTSSLNTRVNNTIKSASVRKPLALSEYGCGGTQHCHSDDFMNTTTTGNYARHDIEYMMWLHEGHIAAIKNFPQLLFTGQWQLFDIAVWNRNEGYTVCLDGENASTDDNLRRLNNKGLVERDHITKKDTFYLYKAWWSSEKFVHICGKDYTKMIDRVIKVYTNDDNNGSVDLYVNNTYVDTATVTDNIVTFTARTFAAGDVVRVDGKTFSDTFTFQS